MPLLPADYVTDDAGTGFVHTAPGHGADDYNTYVKHRDVFAACGTNEVPHTVVAGLAPTSPTCRSSRASASMTTRARMRAPTRR